jgi:hypothetical protein
LEEIGVGLLGPGDAAFVTSVDGHFSFGVACEAAILAEIGYGIGTGLGDLVVVPAFSAIAKKIDVASGAR